MAQEAIENILMEHCIKYENKHITKKGSIYDDSVIQLDS